MNWSALSDAIVDHFSSNRHLVCQLSSLSSNEERVEYCLANQHTRDVLTQYLTVMSAKHLKYWEKAKELRVEGNDCFKMKSFSEAVEYYTRAILSAPLDVECDELSLAFANRSAAFFQLRQFSHCLADISLAIKHNYPKELMSKLVLRRAQCLVEMKQFNEAKQVLSDAIQCHVSDDNAIKIANLLNSLSINEKSMPTNSLNTVKTNENETSFRSSIKFESNVEIPNASSSIKLCVSTSKGRHMKAKQTINMCDVLFIEKPFASVLLPQFYSTRCHHCYTYLSHKVVVGCRQCNRVRYCGEECEHRSWRSYHKYECSHLDVLHDIGIAHLAFRMLLVCGVSEALNVCDADRTQTTPYLNDYNSVFALNDHSSEFNSEDMMRYALVASLLLLLTEKLNLIEKQSEHYFKVGGILLKHILQTIINGHAITSAENYAENSGHLSFQEIRFATGIYPTVSLMNHSCDPNVIAVYDKDVLYVRASREILLGEEVLNCYGPHSKRMPKLERQTLLKQQYFFDCDCKPCSDGTVDISRALRCHSCEGAVIFNEKVENSGYCLNCKKNIEINDILINVEKGITLLNNSSKLIDDNLLLDAEQTLLEAHEIIANYLYCNNREFGRVKDELSRCYARMKDWPKAVEYGRQSVAIVSKVFGDQSIEMCNELIKLSDLEWEWFDSIEPKVEALVTAKICLVTTSRALKLLTNYTIPSDDFSAFNMSEIKKLEERLVFCNLFIKQLS